MSRCRNERGQFAACSRSALQEMPIVKKSPLFWEIPVAVGLLGVAVFAWRKTKAKDKAQIEGMGRRQPGGTPRHDPDCDFWRE